MKKFITLLTVSRIIVAPILFILVLFFQAYGLTLILFMFAAASDYADGYLARKFNLTSILGEVLDPIADKIIITFLLFALSIQL